MQQQSYKNHARFHPMFHYFLVPLAFITVVASILNLILSFRESMELWYAIVQLIASSVLILVLFLTRVYAKKVQDRVMRAEENFRHYVLSGRPLDARLTLTQVIALRFADDKEFVELCSRAADSNLSPDVIKSSIKTWKSDFLRV